MTKAGYCSQDADELCVYYADLVNGIS